MEGVYVNMRFPHVQCHSGKLWLVAKSEPCLFNVKCQGECFSETAERADFV